MGKNAVLAGQETVILLTIEGVRLATEAGADGIHKEGMPPLAQVLREYVEGGGQVWACQS